ncbi:alpha/beta hydrolase [Nonomuraea sp. SYSU D8015]|uniref:alpha/beta hydrolase n=1 Tax=Nonomuraea sp. SYSU D8015 TaxID=2593644 RepID=UPI001CB6EC89|nr:alpha/beta hydrolase [Nonomuraea sp. SYSU D8015]
MYEASPSSLRTPILEPDAAQLVRSLANPPYAYQLGPVEGRKAYERLHRTKADKPSVVEDWLTVPDGPPARIVRPPDATGQLPVVVYLHGCGWVFGNARTHDRVVRELAVRSRVAVVFPEYGLAPEHRYPIALEQCYAVARWVTRHGHAYDLDGRRMAVAGDSAGANLATALALLAARRGDVRLSAQVLFCPVTNAGFDTPSYRRFADGYLRREAMIWFWDQYTTSQVERAQATASPLRAPVAELAGMPPALVVTAEADVLRDEGEAYAAKLRAAGVSVAATRYVGAVHGFAVLDVLRHTLAAQLALGQAADFLTATLHDTSQK